MLIYCMNANLMCVEEVLHDKQEALLIDLSLCPEVCKVYRYLTCFFRPKDRLIEGGKVICHSVVASYNREVKHEASSRTRHSCVLLIDGQPVARSNKAVDHI